MDSFCVASFRTLTPSLMLSGNKDVKRPAGRQGRGKGWRGVLEREREGKRELAGIHYA